MGMFVYTTMGMGWEWEYGHGNRRDWDRKSHSHTSLFRAGHKQSSTYSFTIFRSLKTEIIIVYTIGLYRARIVGGIEGV